MAFASADNGTSMGWIDKETAGYLYNSVAAFLPDLHPEAAEHIAKVTFEHGKDSYERSDYIQAFMWFDRSYNVFLSQNIAQWSPSADEQRMNVLDGLGMAFLPLDTTRTKLTEQSQVVAGATNE